MRALRIQQPWWAWRADELRRTVGLYLHVPFCLARCRYCDFLTYGRERPAGLLPDTYAELLQDELRQRGQWFRAAYSEHGRAIGSVFVGGGTPTFLKPEQLCRIIELARREFYVPESAEVTVEANPETLSRDYIRQLHDAGVNRLSIGVQALQDRHLAFLTRTHRSRTVHQALSAAAAGPIARLSCDLIYGLPGLTHAELRASCRALLDYGVEHVSAYELTVEEGTPLARWARHFPRLLPPPEAVAEQQRAIRRELAGAGMYRYEVSNYARPGRECRHNLRYWLGGDYLGLGLGASSRIGTQIIVNPREIGDYATAVKQVGTPSDPLARACNALAPELRKQAPPADAFLTARTRLGFSSNCVAVNPDWLARRYVAASRGRLHLTSRGLDFADLLGRELPA